MGAKRLSPVCVTGQDANANLCLPAYTQRTTLPTLSHLATCLLTGRLLSEMV
jgi:hypothetical protein